MRTPDKPFGAHALPAPLERLRRLAGGASPEGSGQPSRKLASLARRLCLVGRADPVDAELFPGVSARLHPRSNRCEKVAFAGPQFWDPGERRALAAAIRASDPARPFVFADVGANVGFYSLFAERVARDAGRAIRILAVEPDEVNRGRLEANLGFNGIDSVTVLPVAVSGTSGHGRMAGGEINRGERQLLAQAGIDGLRVVTLTEALAEAGLDRLDAMKLDIEGHDEAALRRFLAEAPAALRPSLLIVEAGRKGDAPVLALCLRNGYSVQTRAGLNAVLKRTG
jgi:FkbM family methyltransferase